MLLLLVACRRIRGSTFCSLKQAQSQSMNHVAPPHPSHTHNLCFLSNEGREDLMMPSKNLEIQTDKSLIWNWWSTPQTGVNDRSIEYKSGHVLGGGTSISTSSSSLALAHPDQRRLSILVDGMVYTRGADDDYDLWGKHAKDRSWSWRGLSPYIRKVR